MVDSGQAQGARGAGTSLLGTVLAGGGACAMSAAAASLRRGTRGVHGKEQLIGWVLLGLAAALVLIAACSVTIGSRDVGVADILAALGGSTDGFGPAAVAKRIPRTLLALLAGAALGISGAVMQGVTRNPLADPGILGISTGASLAAVVGVADEATLRGGRCTAAAIRGHCTQRAGSSSTGSPAAAQARNPPTRSVARWRPRSRGSRPMSAPARRRPQRHASVTACARRRRLRGLRRRCCRSRSPRSWSNRL